MQEPLFALLDSRDVFSECATQDICQSQYLVLTSTGVRHVEMSRCMKMCIEPAEMGTNQESIYPS